MDSRVTKGRNIAIFRWHDNAIVNVASTYLGIYELDTVRRWCPKEKRFIKVHRPEAIKACNENMGD